MSKTICPVTKLTIVEKLEWQNIDIGSNARASFKLVGERILVLTPKQSQIVVSGSVLKTIEARERILKELNLYDDKYILMTDYSWLNNMPQKEERAVLANNIENLFRNGNLIAYLGFGTSFLIRFLMNVGSKILDINNPVRCFKNYEEAIKEAIKILEENKLFIGIDDDNIPVKNSWDYNSDTYRFKLNLLSGNIIYSEHAGEPSEKDLKRYFSFYEELVKEIKENGFQYYCIISSWNGVIRPTWRQRFLYIEGLKKIYKILTCKIAVVITSNRLLIGLIKISTFLLNSKIILAENIKEALTIIQTNERSLENNKNAEEAFIRVKSAWKKKKLIYTHEYVEKSILKILNFMGSINWDKPGVEFEIEEEDVFRSLYESLTLLKADFDNMHRQGIEMGEQLAQNIKLATIGELAAGVVHEVKNPLAIIYGNIEIIKARMDKMNIHDEKILGSLLKQEKSVERISKIVDGLRMYSRKEAESEKSICNMHEIISSSISLIEVLYNKENIFFSIALNAENYNVMGVSDQFQQVLMNMFSNAKDAMASKRSGTIEVQTYNEADNFVLSIKDQGIGIKEESLERVFETFYTTKSAGQGTGLGLGISNKIISKYKGRINIESFENRGTTFLITLPLCEKIEKENDQNSDRILKTA